MAILQEITQTKFEPWLEDFSSNLQDVIKTSLNILLTQANTLGIILD